MGKYFLDIQYYSGHNHNLNKPEANTIYVDVFVITQTIFKQINVSLRAGVGS